MKSSKQKKTSKDVNTPETRPSIQALMPPDKGMPKFSNVANVTKVNENFILSFLFIEPGGSDQAIVIERVLVDRGHAVEIVALLGRMLKA